MEFNVEIQCPRCGCEMDTVAAFNDLGFDQGGGESNLMEERCDNCGKMLWYKASLTFEVEERRTWTKKPKVTK